MDWEKERICSMALGKVFGFEPRVAAALIQHLGSAGAVFDLSPSQRDELLGPYSKHKGALDERLLEDSAQDYFRLSRMNAYYVACNEDSFPLALQAIPDPPVGLYVRSDTPPERLFGSGRPMVGVVGTRDVTPYGLRQCEKLVQALSAVQDAPGVVSGLAFGVDICAHRAALRLGLPTLAVMATGVDAVYPWQHRNDAFQMESTPGCALVSDYPPGTRALAIHFIRRNRIIAGLSRATLLVESKEKGGGMITARLAFDYGREVYAVPGRMEDACSQGCNRLIAEKVAEAVHTPEKWIQAMGFSLKGCGKAREAPRRGDVCDPAVRERYEGRLPPEDVALVAKILSLIGRESGITPGQMAGNLGCPEVKVSTLAAMLEADGLIEVDLLRRCRLNA